MPEFLTVDEAATQLRVSGQTIRNWINDEKLPATRAGRQLRIRPTDIDAFLNARGPTQASAGEPGPASEAEESERERFGRALASVIDAAAEQASPALVRALEDLAGASAALARELGNRQQTR